MKVVLDTCVLKLATLPKPINPSALIVELFLAGDLQAWASPAMIEEYQEVLADSPELFQKILSKLELCYP
ncbi:MAG: PIN domain-containing protein, partial [Limisphaerales bacterium]